MKEGRSSRRKRLLSLVMACVMTLTLCLPTTALAKEKKTAKPKFTSMELAVGDQSRLEVLGWYEKTLWSTDNEDVATVTEHGTVEAVAEGKAVVTAESYLFHGRYKNRTEFTITVGPAREALRVRTGGTAELANTAKMKWTSENPDIAKVSSSGVVTGVQEGSTVVSSKAITSRYHLILRWGNLKATTTRYYPVEVLGDTIAPDTFLVTFQTNGGSVVAEQMVNKGATVTEPEPPEKTSCYFAGWYVDEALKTVYDFTLPVEQDLTLYAAWDESAISQEDYKTDSDNDGIADAFEESLGMDPTKEDSDDDGLSDRVEMDIGYDPAKPDTDGDGVMDLDDDADEDGLSNKEELALGTALNRVDTDADQLTDFEEVKNYQTDPCLADTDGDGVSDGYEVELGTDPRTPQASFKVSATAEDEDTVKASVNIELAGAQVDTLEIKANDNETLFPEEMPGYMGMAYDYSVDGTFTQATIQFAFNKDLLSQGVDPAIFYYNEETMALEELETVIEDGVASATVTHFSTYVLMDRTTYYNAYNDVNFWTDSWDSEGEFNSVEVVLVIDDSGSMSSNDPQNDRLKVARDLVDKLPADSKVGVVSFESNVVRLTQQLTADREAAKNYLTGTYFTSSGGTYMYAGIAEAMNLYSAETDGKTLQMMIVLSDGDSFDSGNHTHTITTAQSKNIRIYTVGLGSQTSYFTNYLQPLATETGGQFYHADEATELAKIYEDINKRIDIETDTDGDKIPDYYEDNMVGFNNLGIKLDKNNPDTDGDGLKDGAEVNVKLIYSEDRSKVRVEGCYLSNPLLKDSDYDGIDDNKENKGCRMDNKITAKAYAGDVSTKVKFTVDYRKFFKDNSAYQKDLAVLGSLYVTDMYSNCYLDFAGYHGANGYGKTSDNDGNTETNQRCDDYAYKEGQGVSFMKTFGLQDVRNYAADSVLDISANPELDTDDVTELSIGHRTVTYRGETRDIIVMMLRGTDGTNREWSSNFDIGADTTEYTNRTGEHPDWKNHDHHKGFDVAANRAMQCFEHYVQNTDLAKSTAPKSIFIAGHSRAAAISNILGSMFGQKQGYDPFVYTFAPPTTTLKADAGAYPYIFNLVNTDDLVTYLPLKEWGFGLYGTTREVSVKDKYEGNWVANVGRYPKNSFEYLFGKDYNSNGQLEKTLKAFNKIGIQDRADLYRTDTGPDGSVLATNKPHFYYENAVKERGELEKQFRDEKLMKFCNMYIENPAYGFNYVAYSYCPAFLLQILANMAAPPNEVGPDLKGVYREARVAFILGSGELVFGGMEHPHMQLTYYMIAMNDFKSL